jgi:hypothetical protein
VRVSASLSGAALGETVAVAVHLENIDVVGGCGRAGRRSKIRAFVENVFAQQKSRMSLFIRTIGIAPARTKIDMANLTYNLTRFV